MLYESLWTKRKRKYKLKSESVLLSALLLSYLDVFCANFEFSNFSLFFWFSGSLNLSKIMFLMSWILQKCPEMIWNEFGKLHFLMIFCPKKSQNFADFERYLHRARNDRFEHLDMQSKLKQHKQRRKNTQTSNDRADFSNFKFWGVKITKMSFNWKFKTSPALTPYYSLSMDEICSTSHFEQKEKENTN